MPYKSKAQQAKFQQLAKEGKISQETVSEFDKASQGAKLPERATPKKMGKMPSIPKIKSMKTMPTGTDRLREIGKKKK